MNENIKKFAKGYRCKSPFWKDCGWDCTDCGMLVKDDIFIYFLKSLWDLLSALIVSGYWSDK